MGSCRQYPVILAIAKVPLDSEVFKWERGLAGKLRRTWAGKSLEEMLNYSKGRAELSSGMLSEPSCRAYLSTVL